MPAHGVEVEKAVAIDVRDDEPELVDVAREHEDGIALGIEGGEPVAESVVRVGIGDRLHMAVEDRLGLGLVAGGRARVQQLSEKGRDFVGRHGFNLALEVRAAKRF